MATAMITVMVMVMVTVMAMVDMTTTAIRIGQAVSS